MPYKFTDLFKVYNRVRGPQLDSVIVLSERLDRDYYDMGSCARRQLKDDIRFELLILGVEESMQRDLIILAREWIAVKQCYEKVSIIQPYDSRTQIKDLIEHLRDCKNQEVNAYTVELMREFLKAYYYLWRISRCHRAFSLSGWLKGRGESA